MILDPLSRHLAVCSLAEVPRFLELDRDFWNVLSIRDSTRSQINLNGARQVLPQYFDDVESNKAGSKCIVMSQPQVLDIWSFVDSTKDGPLLIHCVAGLSRSTAVAAAVIVRSLITKDVPSERLPAETLERLLAIRPSACPNSLVLRRLLEHLMDYDQALRITSGIWEDERVLHNRFVRPR